MQSKIPNWLPALIAVAYFPWALWTGVPLTTLAIQLAASLGLIYVLWLKMDIGGGAVKLMVAVLLWLTFMQGAVFVVLTMGAVVVVAKVLNTKEVEYFPCVVFALAVMGFFGVIEIPSLYTNVVRP